MDQLLLAPPIVGPPPKYSPVTGHLLGLKVLGPTPAER